MKRKTAIVHARIDADLEQFLEVLKRIDIDCDKLHSRINLGEEILGSCHVDLLIIKHYIVKKAQYGRIFLELLDRKVPDRQFISHELELLESLDIHSLCRDRMIKQQNNLFMRQ